MPHRQALSVAFALAAGLAFAPPSHAGYLNGVFSPNGADVIAVGDSGMIYRSVDTGNTWSKTYQGVTPWRATASRGFVILIVGDGGRVLRSTDSGGTWSSSTLPGGPDLLDVEFASPDSAFAVGSSGAVFRSVDAGANWAPQVSGAAGRLRNVKFVDGLHGWIVGDAGFAARTYDGGGSWLPQGPSTPNTLYGVDQNGLRIWMVGASGTCWKSVNDGAGWTPVDLRLDSRADVRAVALTGADSVYLAGATGFLRRSVDDGASWTFLQHPLLGEIAGFCAVGGRLFVASPRAPSVMRSLDRGLNWTFALGTPVVRSWSLKQVLVSGSQRGSTVALNPINRNTIYAAIGNRFYVTRDDGETWTQFSILPASYSKANAFVVSPKDSNVMVCAASPPNVILYSNNGGGSWTSKFAHVFGEYGIPLEIMPDRPDTLLFGVDNDSTYRSVDFGQNWTKFGKQLFRSPCDLVAVPESDSNVVLLGDGITGTGQGELWRSVDGGENWLKVFVNTITSGSEIPGMSTSRLRNKVAFATAWAQGGVFRSDSMGLAWNTISPVQATWGTDICRDDPNVVIYGVYAGALGYISLDGGANFSTSPLPGSNYSFYARDRSCVLAEQSGGVYKLGSTYASTPTGNQSLTVSAPNGGEYWAAGSVHAISWMAAGVPLARIEYQRSSSDPWLPIAVVAGYSGTYSWTVPHDATDTARIRVSDAWDASPEDESDAEFSIAEPLIAVSRDSIAYGAHPRNTSTLDSVMVSNTGNNTLHVTSISTGTATFTSSPATLDLDPGAAAAVHVTFLPTYEKDYADTLRLVSDAYNAPLVSVPLSGTGADTLMLLLQSPNGGNVLDYGEGATILWQSALVSTIDIAYRNWEGDVWHSIATDVPASDGSYAWTLPATPTLHAQVRIEESGGGVQDVSDAEFLIRVPRLVAKPIDVLDLGPVLLADSRRDTLHLCNAGTSPLQITSITCDRPTFLLGRTGFTMLPGHIDTLGFTFNPAGLGRDTAHVVLTTNDPQGTHAFIVTALGTNTTGVESTTPTRFAVWQNQPNPFAGRTLIRYELPHGANVSLEIFNLQGQRVANLVNGEEGAGSYGVPFVARRDDGSMLPAGVYFYRFQAGSFRATRKMLIVR